MDRRAFLRTLGTMSAAVGVDIQGNTLTSEHWAAIKPVLETR